MGKGGSERGGSRFRQLEVQRRRGLLATSWRPRGGGVFDRVGRRGRLPHVRAGQYEQRDRIRSAGGWECGAAGGVLEEGYRFAPPSDPTPLAPNGLIKAI